MASQKWSIMKVLQRSIKSVNPSSCRHSSNSTVQFPQTPIIVAEYGYLVLCHRTVNGDGAHKSMATSTAMLFVHTKWQKRKKEWHCGVFLFWVFFIHGNMLSGNVEWDTGIPLWGKSQIKLQRLSLSPAEYSILYLIP